MRSLQFALAFASLFLTIRAQFAACPYSNSFAPQCFSTGGIFGCGGSATFCCLTGAKSGCGCTVQQNCPASPTPPPPPPPSVVTAPSLNSQPSFGSTLGCHISRNSAGPWSELLGSYTCETCQSTCRPAPACDYYKFISAAGTVGPVSYGTLCPTPAAPVSKPTPSPTELLPDVYYRVDGYSGEDLADIAGSCGSYTSQAAIQQACDANPACKAYIYVPNYQPAFDCCGGWWCLKTTADNGVAKTGAVLYVKKTPSPTSALPVPTSPSAVPPVPTSNPTFPQPNLASGSNAASLSSGAMAGIAVGAVVAVVIVILIVFLLVRKRATTAYGAPSANKSQQTGSFHDVQRNPMQMQ